MAKIFSANKKIKFTNGNRKKRTSQGTRHKPKNRHARKNFKRYRGQGRV
jgi:hypothetical protein